MLYSTIRDFQSGIVGILGFVGVVITLLVNAHLAQAARVQQINQTRVTIQTALREELHCIHDELVNLEGAFNDTLAQPVFFTLEQPYVYQTLVKDIGSLETKQAQIIIRVHRDLYLLLNSIKELAVDPSKKIAIIEQGNFPKAAELVTHALKETNDAIKVLKIT